MHDFSPFSARNTDVASKVISVHTVMLINCLMLYIHEIYHWVISKSQPIPLEKNNYRR